MTMNANEALVGGMKKGWTIAIGNMLPNVILAFALIQGLHLMGILPVLGTFCAPIMGFFGLPGEAITVLLTTWLSAGGGVGTAASLFAQGILTAQDVSILAPAIFLMGAQLQYAGRLLAVADVSKQHYPVLFGIGILNACLSMLTMRWLVV